MKLVYLAFVSLILVGCSDSSTDEAVGSTPPSPPVGSTPEQKTVTLQAGDRYAEGKIMVRCESSGSQSVVGTIATLVSGGSLAIDNITFICQ